MRSALLLASGMLALAACDRPLVAPDAPTIEVVSPDLDAVQPGGGVELRIEAGALRGVERVTVNGAEAERDVSGLWVRREVLAPGANAFVLEAFAADGSTAADTAFAIALPLAALPLASTLPEPRAGHTATATAAGVLVAGGTGEGERVLVTARLASELASGFVFGDPIALASPRTGHTATALPDGRVLLLGGTVTPAPEPPASFAATPEAVDPASGESRAVVVEGVPLRRTGHVVTLIEDGGRLLLTVLGGRAPATDGRVFTPGAIEFFELHLGAEADTLVRLSPAGGIGGPANLPDPAQIGLGVDAAETLLAGLASGASALRLTYSVPGFTTPVEVDAEVPGLPFEPRTEADGVRLGEGLALLAGGAGAGGGPLASMEVYAERARRFFRAPVRLSTPRRAHTVTLAPSGRILVLGGRDASDRPTPTLEVIAF